MRYFISAMRTASISILQRTAFIWKNTWKLSGSFMNARKGPILGIPSAQ